MALPYTWQLITLAILLGKRPPTPLSDAEERGLMDWVWVTTYGEVFAGVNSAIYDRASDALQKMMQGTSWKGTSMAGDVSAYVEEITRFDFRAARAKAFALVLAREFDGGKQEGDGHRALAERGAQALETLRPGKPRSDWSELTIVPSLEDLRAVRELLKVDQQQVLWPAGGPGVSPSQLGFPGDDFPGDVDAWMKARRSHLLKMEKEFVKSLELHWR
ncbi:MAG: hypothetical protein HY815_05410 [Candidatus Riflebacteria bacterium]|nr:hypothetical protein [Candidatus Riflebacteria bacterium]